MLTACKRAFLSIPTLFNSLSTTNGITLENALSLPDLHLLPRSAALSLLFSPSLFPLAKSPSHLTLKHPSPTPHTHFGAKIKRNKQTANWSHQNIQIGERKHSSSSKISTMTEDHRCAKAFAFESRRRLRCSTL